MRSLKRRTYRFCLDRAAGISKEDDLNITAVFISKTVGFLQCGLLIIAFTHLRGVNSDIRYLYGFYFDNLFLFWRQPWSLLTNDTRSSFRQTYR